MTSERSKLLAYAQSADDAWQLELERVYGKRAGDARYDSRGTATPALKRLHDVFMSEMGAYAASYSGSSQD